MTVLTATMILGVLTIVALLVIRLQAPPPPVLALPDAIALPGGTEALAVTHGPSWYAVVTADQRILLFDRATGRLFQTVEITRPE